jgi:hypothetical protein
MSTIDDVVFWRWFSFFLQVQPRQTDRKRLRQERRNGGVTYLPTRGEVPDFQAFYFIQLLRLSTTP